MDNDNRTQSYESCEAAIAFLSSGYICLHDGSVCTFLDWFHGGYWDYMDRDFPMYGKYAEAIADS